MFVLTRSEVISSLYCYLYYDLFAQNVKSITACFKPSSTSLCVSFAHSSSGAGVSYLWKLQLVLGHNFNNCLLITLCFKLGFHYCLFKYHLSQGQSCRLRIAVIATRLKHRRCLCCCLLVVFRHLLTHSSFASQSLCYSLQASYFVPVILMNSYYVWKTQTITTTAS